VFSLETTTQEFSLRLPDGKGHCNPYIRVIEGGKIVLGIAHAGYFSYEAFDDTIDVFNEEQFTQLSNEFFQKLTGYKVSKWEIGLTDFKETQYPHCLQIELTKETDSGIETRVLSIIPCFCPCIQCDSDSQLDVVYKVGDATIKKLLIAPFRIFIHCTDWSEAKEKEMKEEEEMKKV
jgi:hypothetical protein